MGGSSQGLRRPLAPSPFSQLSYPDCCPRSHPPRLPFSPPPTPRDNTCSSFCLLSLSCPAFAPQRPGLLRLSWFGQGGRKKAVSTSFFLF